jgi:MFS transporter, DHA1 family, multidrug resistance protein
MVFLVSLYVTFVYGLLYLFLTAYPIVFQGIHGMSSGVAGFLYLGITIGMLFSGLFIALTQPSYSRKLLANYSVPVPEWRLPPAIIGGVLFACGHLWFG